MVRRVVDRFPSSITSYFEKKIAFAKRKEEKKNKKKQERVTGRFFFRGCVHRGEERGEEGKRKGGREK